MGSKRCLACADLFTASTRVPEQSYCSRPECQRERKRLWQREKRKVDDDYRANQKECQKRWQESHSSYWMSYREQHPEYAARNREMQRTRNQKRRGGSQD